MPETPEQLEPQPGEAWRRKCNDKTYTVDRTHTFFGRRMVWAYMDGTNRIYHLPLKTFLTRYERI